MITSAVGGVTTDNIAMNSVERSSEFMRSRLCDVGDSRRKIGEHRCTFGHARLVLGLCALAGQHQHRLGANGLRCLQIAQRIADGRHAGEIDIEAERNVLEHAGLGLAAIAVVVAGMRTEKDRVNAPARLSYRAIHFLVNGVERVHLEQAAADARLVGAHHDAITPLIEAGDGLRTAGDRQPFFRRLDEVIRVVVDDAITIEDDEFHEHIFTAEGAGDTKEYKENSGLLCMPRSGGKLRQIGHLVHGLMQRR